jgi:predicted nucleic-acid-binding Zn-ribbon protein
MTTLKPVTKCPKCGGREIDRAAFAKANPNDLLTCPHCGNQSTKDELVAELLNESARRLQIALRNISGFKSK